MIQAFRVKVSPDESAIVQRNLFNAGYSWITGEKKILNTAADYLFFDKDGDLTYSYTVITDRNNDLDPEISFQEFLEIFDGRLQVWDKNEVKKCIRLERRE